MSAYSTITITREEAERVVMACRNKGKYYNALQMLSDEEIDKELHMYVYSGNYTDEVGLLYNYEIK